jgi:catechol 2,3-dioxygenase
MHVHTLGHVVLKVQSLERSESFYSGVLRMPVISRLSEPVPMTFFTLGLGNHHDFAIMEVGDQAPRPDGDATGLAHVAFKVGDSSDELRATRSHLHAVDIDITREMDHTVTKSLYVHDPDGHEIELYVDVSDA